MAQFAYSIVRLAIDNQLSTSRNVYQNHVAITKLLQYWIVIWTAIDGTSARAFSIPFNYAPSIFNATFGRIQAIATIKRARNIQQFPARSWNIQRWARNQTNELFSGADELMMLERSTVVKINRTDAELKLFCDMNDDRSSVSSTLSLVPISWIRARPRINNSAD